MPNGDEAILPFPPEIEGQPNQGCQEHETQNRIFAPETQEWSPVRVRAKPNRQEESEEVVKKHPGLGNQIEVRRPSPGDEGGCYHDPLE